LSEASTKEAVVIRLETRTAVVAALMAAEDFLVDDEPVLERRRNA
jgi:hypothetical protein